MGKEVTLATDNGEPKRSLFGRVNDVLKSGTANGQNEITIQDIASEIGIDIPSLYEWLKSDDQFQRELTNYIHMPQSDLFKDKVLANRLDATTLALLLLETKKRYK